MHVQLCYFSGTGNTEVIVENLAASLAAQNVDASLHKMEDVLHQGNVPWGEDADDVLGIAYPVYAYNPSSIVFDFLRMLPIKKGGKAFVLLVGSGSEYFNSGAITSVKRKLKRKGYAVFNEAYFIMPHNILNPLGRVKMRTLCEDAIYRADVLAQEVAIGEGKPLFYFAVPRLLSLIGRMEHNLFRKFGNHLHADERCNHCLLCVRECPTDNIAFRGDKMVFGDKCLMCMRCVYHCPEKAINPFLFSVLSLKTGYNIESVAWCLSTRPKKKDAP